MQAMLLSALELGALASAALAQLVVPTTASRTGAVALTDEQMDAVTAGAHATARGSGGSPSGGTAAAAAFALGRRLGS